MIEETAQEHPLVESYSAFWELPLSAVWIVSGIVMGAAHLKELATVAHVAKYVFFSIAALAVGDSVGSLLEELSSEYEVIPVFLVMGFIHMLPLPFNLYFSAATFVSFAISVVKKSSKILKNAPKGRLEDLIPLGDSKQKIEEVISYLRNPLPFTSIGAKPPRAILLAGPPGTGKTLLGKALANEMGPYTSFIQIACPELKSSYIAESSRNIRRLFAGAKEAALMQQRRIDLDAIENPELKELKGFCLIFIDEIDSLGSKKRGDVGGNVSLRQDHVDTINEMLAQMDGFETDDRVVVIGTTNNKELLDSALLSRFPCQIETRLPLQHEREAIFDVHLKGSSIVEPLDMAALGRQAAGFSGRDIKYVVEAALWSAGAAQESGLSQGGLLKAIAEMKSSRGGDFLFLRELFSCSLLGSLCIQVCTRSSALSRS